MKTDFRTLPALRAALTGIYFIEIGDRFGVAFQDAHEATWQIYASLGCDGRTRMGASRFSEIGVAAHLETEDIDAAVAFIRGRT
jgi:hypothetical protein